MSRSSQWRTPEMEERIVRSRRRASLFGAAFMVPYFIEDLYRDGPNAHWLIGVKVLWGLILGGTALALPSVSPKTRSQFLEFVTLTSGLCMAAIAYLHGDHQTPYFAWLIALPFCLVVFSQDEVGAAVSGSAATFFGAAAILFTADVSLVHRTQWLMCIATSASLAIYAAIYQRRHLREEFLQNRARLDALDRLAQSEKLRAQGERMALVGQLAAGVAHEINNPLGSVSSNLEFLEADLATPTMPPEERRLVMLETQLGLERIKAIVRDLTAFCREGVEKCTEVDLYAVVTEAQRAAAARTGLLGIHIDLPPGMRRVMGNQEHLAQVFLNLILNAADAMGTQATTGGKIWIRASHVGADVQIDVEDNGPGFADAVLANLFQPFFTTKAPGKGTGLGLATSREYMRRAGGDLHAGPRPGGGARFTLALRSAP
jgi:C4-dicarboxylate-specific signal transduction histidine kinase